MNKISNFNNTNKNYNLNNLKFQLNKIKDYLNTKKEDQILKNIKAEIILLVYQRPFNLDSILNALSNQTYKNFKINILNNNKSANEKINKIIKRFSNLNINLKHANQNLGSKAKFQIAKNTKGNPIIFLDDDMIPEQDFVEYMIKIQKKYGKNYILGWYGYQFMNESYIKGRKFIQPYEESDFIGSGSMIIDRSIIENIKETQKIPNYIKKIEDLWLSYLAKKYNYKLLKIEKKVKHLEDELDQFHKIKKDKEIAFKILRNKNWKLIREKKQIKFHILVTTYNFERYIKECINSIKNQNYKNFECIIVDDGSKDKTKDLIKDLIKLDPRFSLYSNNKNRGAAYSRYRGFQFFKAKNQDICMYIDGDDYLIHNNVLNRILDEYQDKNCWFTYGSYNGPFENLSKPLPSKIKTNKDFRKNEWIYGHPRTYRYFLLKNLKKNDFKGPDGKFLPTCTDIGFLYPLLEMSGKKRIKYISDILYFYREHSNNTWKKNNKEYYRKFICSKKPYPELI